VKEVVHFYFHVEDEVSAVKELSQGGFTIKLPRYLNINLLCNFLQLIDS
jgi:hypothetical protein